MTRRKKFASWGKGHRAQTLGDQQATEPTLDLRPWGLVSGWQKIAVKDLLSLNNFESVTVSQQKKPRPGGSISITEETTEILLCDLLGVGVYDGNALQGILRQFHLLSNHLAIHRSPCAELAFAPVSPCPFPDPAVCCSLQEESKQGPPHCSCALSVWQRTGRHRRKVEGERDRLFLRHHFPPEERLMVPGVFMSLLQN